MPLIPSLNEYPFGKEYARYEMTLEDYHGCDKYASDECEVKCIEECSDDLDCCQCGCECMSPMECYGKFSKSEEDVW